MQERSPLRRLDAVEREQHELSDRTLLLLPPRAARLLSQFRDQILDVKVDALQFLGEVNELGRGHIRIVRLLDEASQELVLPVQRFTQPRPRGALRRR